MDEPLSSLDAQLRTHARSEIKRLQAETGTTTVYVTHDQVEAMTMGDRIAVMSHAELVQCGTPEEVYRRPATTFVAGFIGSPAMNLIQTDIASPDGVWRVRIGDQVATLGTPRSAPADAVRSLGAVRTIGIRPEDLRSVVRSRKIGPLRYEEELYSSRTSDGVRFVHVEVAKGVTLIAESSGWGFERQGDLTELTLRWAGLHLFGQDGEALAHFVQERTADDFPRAGQRSLRRPTGTRQYRRHLSMTTSPSVLVTGASGFIGRRLLAAMPDGWTVFAASRGGHGHRRCARRPSRRA